MTSSTLKSISQQRLFSILQDCKQIPKDGRLLLRKMIKDGDEQLKKLLSDNKNKKMQIGLRKYLQRYKQNKKIQQICHIATRNNTINSKYIVALYKDQNDQQCCATLSRDCSSQKYIPNSHHCKNKKCCQGTKSTKDFHLLHQQCKITKSNSASHSDLVKVSNNGQVLRLSNSANLKNKYYNFNPCSQKDRTSSGDKDKELINTCKRLKNKNDQNNSHIPLQNHLNNSSKYKLQSNYLKQGEQNIFTSLQLVKKDKCYNNINLKSGQSISQTVSLCSSRFENPVQSLLLQKSKQQPQHFSTNQGVCWQRPSLKNSPLISTQLFNRQPVNKEQNMYNFKCALIKYYAEDLFDYITSKYFPSTISQKSVYLPYRQFIIELQNYLNSKGQNIEIIKQNDVNVPLMQPFTNQYQGISLKNFGIFLNKFCKNKNSVIRGVFIVLDSVDSFGVTLEKFSRINSWKGNQLILSFERLVKKWGEGNNINYWQAYRAKNQKQFTQFESLYSQT